LEHKELQPQTQKKAASPSGFDVVVRNNSERMMKEGQQIFRFDTFGSEAFWGDALQLHKAIAGEKNGGVGGGVSPKTALSVGLKVDSDALPDSLKQQLKEGKGGSRRSRNNPRPTHVELGRGCQGYLR
jgi:hypothetical protein